MHPKSKVNPIHIAPMMEWTDRHCRYFLRQLSQHCLLYTEMVHANALLHGPVDSLLAYSPEEHPLVLQLGGSDPNTLATAAKIAENLGYDAINLNVGCPSPRVQAGRFGACLMAEPDLVADCVASMQAKVRVPVTVKTRIGIDDRDSQAELEHFIATVAQTGCQTFIIHARKAWLHGLSPKENREIPPLRYDMALALRQAFPHLTLIVNGGITTHEAIFEKLTQFDGVMLGRAAYHDPYVLAECDSRYYQSHLPVPTRHEVVERMLPYIEAQCAQGVRLHQITRHMLGLFHAQQHGRIWRRVLSEEAHAQDAGIAVLMRALSSVSP